MTRSDWDAEPPTEVLRVPGAVDTDPDPVRSPATDRDDARDDARDATVSLATPARDRAASTRQLPPDQDQPSDGRRRADRRDVPRPVDVDRRGPGRPRRRRRSWLIRLAGGDEEILARAPADRPKFVSMGAVLIGTSAVAGVSAAFAMNAAVKLSPWPAALVGLLWGLVILNLDRMLVVSMETTAGVRRSLVTAIPRLVLAAVIGAIISMPLVLRIFQPEIDAELQKMQAEALSAAQTALNQDVRFTAIPDLEKEEARLIPIAAGQAAADVGSDPEVARLRDQLAAKDKEYTDAENLVICEGGGATCGSGVPGKGPIYQDLVQKRDRLQAQRDDLQRQLDAATAAARTRINAGSQEQIQVAQSDLRRVQDQLAGLRADKQNAENAIKDAEQKNTGLLAQLQALDRLTRGSWMMLTAHGALFLLFLLIEALPVLVKVLAAAGSPTLYDQLLAKRERESLEEADDDVVDRRADQEERARARDAEEAARAKIRATQAEMALTLEQHRAEAQIEAGKRANEALAAKQEELAAKAIAVWGQVAEARTDEELRYWYERHMNEQKRTATERDPGGRAARTAESRQQAISYSDFMAQRGTASTAAPRPSPHDRRPARVDEDGIYRPAPSTRPPEDGPRAFAPPRRDPVDTGADGYGTGRYGTDRSGDPESSDPAVHQEARPERAADGAATNGSGSPATHVVDPEADTWNPDAYQGEVAPPPVAPRRGDR